MTAGPSPIDRKLYGDLADDIVLLRSDDRVVSRYKSGFRVDSWPEIFTAAQVRGMAATVRNRRLSAATALVTKNGHEITGADAQRSRMAAHRIERTTSRAAGGVEGRDAVRQGSAAAVDRLEPSAGAAGGAEAPAPITRTGEYRPSGESEGTPAITDRAGVALAKHICAKCGGPRSKWSRELCKGCYVPTGRPPNPKPEARNPFEQAAPARVPAGDPGQPGGSHVAPAPAPEVARPATPATDLAARLATNPLGALCGCGMLRSHVGRCWHRRGLADPGPVASKPKPSKVARDGNITALWAAVDALTSASARLEKAVAELRGLLSMEGLR
jgi:hypothetical protein